MEGAEITSAEVANTELGFVDFVTAVEPRLRRALVALRGPDDGRDATAEALAWAWEHWSEVTAMANPAGYLYRVGQSRSRRRLPRWLPARAVVEPSDPSHHDLAVALRGLSERQRVAVVLVHGCGWTYDEVAEALGVSKSSVGTHVQRGLARLRAEMEESP